MGKRIVGSDKMASGGGSVIWVGKPRTQVGKIAGAAALDDIKKRLDGFFSGFIEEQQDLLKCHEGSEVPQRPQQCSSGGITHPASLQR